MSKADLLKYANENKPVDFSKEFKNELNQSIQTRLNPSKEEEKEGTGDEE